MEIPFDMEDNWSTKQSILRASGVCKPFSNWRNESQATLVVDLASQPQKPVHLILIRAEM
jgi:hypothetical protein